MPSYRRGYAMVRCALDLGLRVGEIAKLSLDDIDWHAGTVTLRRTKSRCEDILPLPPDKMIVAAQPCAGPGAANAMSVFVPALAPPFACMLSSFSRSDTSIEPSSGSGLE